MSTQSWSTRLRHDSDAVYQEWRDELITKLNLLVTSGELAADETNITPGAGARPGTNTEQGYAVYHLNDSLHGTAPVYFRFGFGTYSSANNPRITIQVGTSTNGSGVLGGTTSGNQIPMSSQSQTSDTARQSYMCAAAGFFGMNWKIGVQSRATFWFCRSCDSDGVPTSTGGVCSWGADPNDVGTHGFRARQSFRYAATAVAYTAQTTAAAGQLGFSPFVPASTVVDGNIQVFLGWMILPLASPIFGACGVYNSELTAGGTFTATLVGSTPRTYLTLNTGGKWDANFTCDTAMLWE